MKGSIPRKLPKNYEVVLGVIQSAGHGVHLTMAEVLVRARVARPPIGASTVYRGLQRLRDHGLVEELTVPGSEAVIYELAGASHAHFRCDACGRIEDVESDVDARTFTPFERRTGSRVTSTKLTLHGRCRVCIDAAAAGNAGRRPFVLKV